ncbi:F-box domain-containing protein [Artemisia annua]|uniref:F-box domain-containing protein n=1 Tax=Artemisia annua TaxID=35608 RepID=A0A2U1M3W4_ARTAN|nr:F-box domain-containing protein [Artemisia annua]
MKRQKSELLLYTIQTEILPRLPIKSLGRFQCVCKQWKSFLSSQEFIKLHKSRNKEKFLLLEPSIRAAKFHSFDCEPHYYPVTTLKNVPFEVKRKNALLLASLDGLVCVGFKNSRKLMFWNPLTGAYKYLSNSKYHAQAYVPYSDAIGFYNDTLNDCYKILHVNRKPSGSCMAYIYSQRLDTWKKIKFLENAQRFSKHQHWSPVTFANGSLYFTIQGSQGERLTVISFDVNSETFKEIQCPSGAKKCTKCTGRLVVVNDCIHLCVSSGMIRDSYWHYELDLWRMNGKEGGRRWSLFP